MGSLISGLSVMTVGLLILVLGILSAIRKLPMNSLAGLRFPSTMVDDSVWRHSHRKAAPWMVLSGLGATVAGTAAVITQDATGGWVMGGVGWMLVMILIASYVATQAAKKVPEQDTADHSNNQR